MERGVVVGGLMIFGSFLLAALLNRSAMEEVRPPPAPAAAVAPTSPPASEAQLAPGPIGCAETQAQVNSHPSATETEQPAPDRCGKPD